MNLLLEAAAYKFVFEWRVTCVRHTAHTADIMLYVGLLIWPDSIHYTSTSLHAKDQIPLRYTDR